jgi:GTP-binding protein EngB required for normal cell division
MSSSVKIFKPSEYISTQLLEQDISGISEETLTMEYRKLRHQQVGYARIFDDPYRKEEIEEALRMIERSKRFIKDSYEIIQKFEEQHFEVEKVVGKIKKIIGEKCAVVEKEISEDIQKKEEWKWES